MKLFNAGAISGASNLEKNLEFLKLNVQVIYLIKYLLQHEK